MASTLIPAESLPRRSLAGTFQPIVIHVRVRDGNYHPKHIPIPGRPFRDLRALEDAARDYYNGIYLSSHRRKRPLDPPPSTDGVFKFRFQMEHVPRRPTPSAPQKPADVESLKALLDTTKLGEKSSGSTDVSSSCSSRESDRGIVMASPPSESLIWGRVRNDWGFMYYIRVDPGGSFHTYPHSGGPFQSDDEAERAMDRYFHEHRDPKLLMNQGGPSSFEITIEKTLYWPDGRRRKRSKSILAAQAESQMHRLVQAPVDKHNDDHKLFGDLAYELKDVVYYQRFYEKPTWFYHLNFTMTKVARDFNCDEDNLFFAEVKCVSQRKQDELYVSCICMVEPTNNGYCHGCTRNGKINMKHPGVASEYIGGHLFRELPLASYSEFSDSEDDVEAKKKEIRYMFTGTDDPNVKTILWMHPDDVPLPPEDHDGTMLYGRRESGPGPYPGPKLATPRPTICSGSKFGCS